MPPYEDKFAANHFEHHDDAAKNRTDPVESGRWIDVAQLLGVPAVNGSIVMRQHKTGIPHFPRIRPDTYVGIGALVGDRPLACPYKSQSDWYTFWKKNVITPAGVRHGALQQIRRTGATHLAIGHPEAVQRYLGHRTPSMQRHYVDQSIATPQQHLPPDIGAA